MTTIGDVCHVLEQLAPLHLAEDWDNVGLLLGDRATGVTRAITCLTLTADVAAEAVRCGAELVVTHHPILFKPVKQITAATAEGRMLSLLMRHEIAVYSPHTAWDNSAGGINQQLAERLALNEIRPLRPRPAVANEPAAGTGSGRYGTLSQPLSLRELNLQIARELQQPFLQTVGDESLIVERLGIACGAAAEFLSDAHRLGCQALLTGEARFHACLEARERGMGLILPGHYATERFSMEVLARQLGDHFTDLVVQASESERDPVMTLSASP